jgi:6-phosphogluconolactonase (cycloisomerase 2 family)
MPCASVGDTVRQPGYLPGNVVLSTDKEFAMQKFITRTLLASVLLIGLAALIAAPVAADDAHEGAVFVGTNHNNSKKVDPTEPANQVIMYHRAIDGSLSLVGRFDTGGQGSGPSIRFAGDGLGAAHSVELSQDKRFLFVTNAGSNDVSVFRVSATGLDRTDLVSSGGVFPNSVTQDGDLVYVLNSAGAGNITGFRLSQQGKLTPIPNSTRVINGNQDPVRPDTLFNPTQVSFTPDGRHLVVTIKDGPVAGLLPEFLPEFLPQSTPPIFITPTGPGRVLVFGVDHDGRPTDDFEQTDLDNTGPFGFSFDRQGHLLIALFLGGPPVPGGSPTGAIASFRIKVEGSLTGITVAALDFQLDTCWFENNGKYGYSANYTSGTISSFRIDNRGGVRLLDRKAGITDPGQNRQGSTPLDIRVVDQFVYDVLPGTGKVAGWRIKDDGSLDKIGEFPITILVGGSERLLKTINGDVAMCGDQPCEFGPGASPAGIAGY